MWNPNSSNNRPIKVLQHSLVLKPLEEIKIVSPAINFLNLLWHCGWMFATNDVPRPNWSGFMDRSSRCDSLPMSNFAELHGVSKIDYLPIIDLNANDPTCVYSTLKYILAQSEKQKVHTACVTFDQPLYKLARTITEAEKFPIVVRLGGFHMLMSFLGSVGTLMKGSGLEELFETIYPSNTVGHMFSGKAVARALRGHMMAHSAIMTLLLENLDYDYSFLKSFYEKAMNNTLEEEEIQNILSSGLLSDLYAKIDELKVNMKKKSRTAT